VKRRTLVMALSIILALTVAAPTVFAADKPPVVVPPEKGNYAKLSAKWWKWAYSIPAPDNPLVVQTETDASKCAVGQQGRVWFLGGLFAFPGEPFPPGPVERTCNVPKGKSIFFPILNVECSRVESNPPPVYPNGTPIPSDPSAVNTLGKCAKYIEDWGLGLLPAGEPPGSGEHSLATFEASVDGKPIQNLDPATTPYRVASGPFKFKLPENNINTFCLADPPDGNLYQCPPGKSRAAADGVYLRLAPLPEGTHTIHFGGTFFDGSAALDVTYHIKQR
jgi:hypothetical protein